MTEIRLAVCHPEEGAVAAVAARLRGAPVERCLIDAGAFEGPPEGCGAVMIGRPALAALGELEHILAAGSHLVIVASPCPPVAAVERLAGRAKQCGVQFAAVNPDRYLPSRQLIRKQLSAIGEPGLVRVRRWEPPTGSVTEPTHLPEALLRDLDTTLWLLGRRPNRAYATSQAVGASGRIVQAHLGFATGASALLDYTNTLPAGDSYHSLSVIAASGAAYADDQQNQQLLYRGGRAQAIRAEEESAQLAGIAQEFVNALREGRDPAANAGDWKGVAAVAEALETSLASGRASEL